MVATVLKLRYRLLANMLARSPWQFVGFIFGIIGALSGLFVVVAALFLIGLSGVDATHSVVTLGGALLVVGWSIAPLLAGGVDTTIEAEQLAPFPLTTRQVLLALTLVGVCGIPGIVTTLGALIGLVASGSWPITLLATIVCLPLGVLTCVVASRTVASFSSRGRGRLGNVLGLVGFGVLVLAGPIVTGLLSVLGDRSGLDTDRVGSLITGLSWTPVGAVWAVPGDLADGELWAGLLKLAIAVATLAALWLLWRRNVVAASVSPKRRVAS
ncbi:MAG TPA: hypothetical protein VFN04_05815, partial [Protaetiibacter sp.]|nr:hypothetical protein [Protaetiibacter sp.]